MEDEHKRIQFRAQLDALPKIHPLKLILIICWSMIMPALDNTIINISLPSIQTEPYFVPIGEVIPQSTIQWISDIYSIAYAAFAIPASSISDKYGVTVVHRYGEFGFVFFSILCGCCKFISYEKVHIQYGGFYFLVLSRFFQGIFAAFLMSTTLSISGLLVERKLIAQSMAYNSLCYAAAQALGPTVGGILTQYLGWEWSFFINLFLGIISITICWIYLPKTPKVALSKIDFIGTALVLLGLILLILGLSYLAPDKQELIFGSTCTVSGILLLAYFIVFELRINYGILPKNLIKNSQIVFCLFAGLFNYAISVTILFQLPFVLQVIQGYKPLIAGLIMLVTPLATIVASVISCSAGRKITSNVLKLISSVVAAVFIVVLGFTVQFNVEAQIPLQFIYSCALSVFFISNNGFMMTVASSEIRGALSGTIQSFRETGYALGITIVNLVHDVCMGVFWPGKIPAAGDVEFALYSVQYYKTFAISTMVVSGISLIGMFCGLMSGQDVSEEQMIGYYRGKRDRKFSIIKEVEIYIK